MSTVFKRIAYYCERNKKKLPSQAARILIADLVKQKWFSPSNNLRHPIQKVTYTVAGIEYKVLAYPKKFTPFIDEIIIEYMLNLPEKKIRKRIPSTPKPIYSTKNL